MTLRSRCKTKFECKLTANASWANPYFSNFCGLFTIVSTVLANSLLYRASRYGKIADPLVRRLEASLYLPCKANFFNTYLQLQSKQLSNIKKIKSGRNILDIYQPTNSATQDKRGDCWSHHKHTKSSPCINQLNNYRPRTKQKTTKKAPN